VAGPGPAVGDVRTIGVRSCTAAAAAEATRARQTVRGVRTMAGVGRGWATALPRVVRRAG